MGQDLCNDMFFASKSSAFITSYDFRFLISSIGSNLTASHLFAAFFIIYGRLCSLTAKKFKLYSKLILDLELLEKKLPCPLKITLAFTRAMFWSSESIIIVIINFWFFINFYCICMMEKGNQ